MKFTCSVEVNQPIQKTKDLFLDDKYLSEWQDGFESFEHLSGEPRQPGAKAMVTYNQKGRKIELFETLQVYNLPDEFRATYEHKHMDNILVINMRPVTEQKTKIDFHVEYTAVRGFMPKLMMFLFPGMFKKQVQKWLDQFKVFAEKM